VNSTDREKSIWMFAAPISLHFDTQKKHVKRCVLRSMWNLGISHPRCGKMPVRFRILKHRLRRCASSEAQLQKLQVSFSVGIPPETWENIVGIGMVGSWDATARCSTSKSSSKRLFFGLKT